MEATKKITGGLVALIAIMIVPMIILRGYVISLYWDWFVVASFGVPSIGIAAAIGISALIHYVAANHNVTTKKQDPKEALIGSIVYMLSFAGLGYILSLFV